MAQHHMLLAQCRHQQLVYRADDKVCQQRLLAAPEPLMHLHPLLFCFRGVPVVLHRHDLMLQADIFFVQFRHAVRKPDRSGQVIGLIFCPLQQTRKDAIRRCLRGQTKEDAARPKAYRQNFRCRQRRLGLSHAHLCFQNQNARCIHGVGGFHGRLLHRIWGKAKPLCKFLRLCNDGLRRPRRSSLLFIPFAPRPICTFRINLLTARLFHRDQREIIRVAGDPVRHDQKPRQQNLFGLVEHRQRVHSGIAAVLQCRLKQFVPKALPDALLLFRVVVDFPACKLFVNFCAVLWLAMMGTRDRSDPVRAPQFSQNCFTCPGMGRFAPIQFLAAQRS